jgi:CDP-glycerol glycerophosphotransferase
MSELLLITDLLITDYSSCAGDFALLGKPIFLFQSDIEEYKDLTGLNFLREAGVEIKRYNLR